MSRNGKRRPARGMTLIEILVVLVIIGLIASAVAVNVMGRLQEAKVQQVQNDFKTLENCLDLYKLDKGHYPSTEEGLQAIAATGKCKISQDPWKHDYVYLYPGQAHPDSFDLKSYGADGVAGGDGDNADLVNK